jgi:GNAT superfamily N-acetyltransferase
MTSITADWHIERLGRSHDRSGFSCGKTSLDDFIRKLVTQYEKRDLGRTYVAVRPGESQVCGYYTLASAKIEFLSLPETVARKLPAHPVPTILLARLAVERSGQGQGLGEALLIDALHRSLSLADMLGILAIEVDAIDIQAKSFYEKYGFVPLLDDGLHLFLPIATLRGGRRGS